MLGRSEKLPTKEAAPGKVSSEAEALFAEIMAFGRRAKSPYDGLTAPAEGPGFCPSGTRKVAVQASRDGQTRTVHFFDRTIAVRQARSLLNSGYDVLIEQAGTRVKPADFDGFLSTARKAPAAGKPAKSVAEVVDVLNEILRDMKLPQVRR
jgi:hypothetical protein